MIDVASSMGAVFVGAVEARYFGILVAFEFLARLRPVNRDPCTRLVNARPQLRYESGPRGAV